MDQHYHTSFEPLMVRHLLGETSPEESRVVEDWLSADAANRHYYQQLKLIWEKSGSLSFPGLAEEPGDEERAWESVSEKLHQPGRRSIRYLPWVAAAAVILLPVLFIGLFGWPGDSRQQTVYSNDHLLSDTLRDGSIVLLNTHSTLTQNKMRSVDLQGEAFFRITANKEHPFLIHSNGIDITVLGTSFNVNANTASTTVTVETGIIKITNRHGAITLIAGETITLREADTTLIKQSAAPALHAWYHPRDFICRDTPLWQLTEALQQAYGTPIVIADSGRRNLLINAHFKDESLDRILDVIRQTLNLTVTKSGDSFILK